MGAGIENFGDYGRFSEIGFDATEAKKKMFDDMNSAVGLGKNNTNIGTQGDDGLREQVKSLTLGRQRFSTAYGIDENNQRGMDPFLRQNKQGANEMLAELMISGRDMVSNKSGTILGSLANEKLSQMIKLMEQQKEVSIRTNSTLATSLLKAGNTIGGQFRDDRGGDRMGSVVDNLSSSNNDVVKAMVMQILLKKYGNLPDATAAREGLSANTEDLKEVMSQIGNRFGTGNAAKMFLGPSGIGLFNKQTDANSFLNNKGFTTTANQISTDQDAQKGMSEKVGKFMDALTERAKNLTLNTDALKVEAKNAFVITPGTGLNLMTGNNAAAIEENPVK
jgi:hypothetical protein